MLMTRTPGASPASEVSGVGNVETLPDGAAMDVGADASSAKRLRHVIASEPPSAESVTVTTTTGNLRLISVPNRTAAYF
jgi:hypothetical protein